MAPSSLTMDAFLGIGSIARHIAPHERPRIWARGRERKHAHVDGLG